MSKEVAILVKCDLCQVGSAEASITEDYPLRAGKTEREVDLCTLCKEKLDEIIAPYLGAGRRPMDRRAPRTNGQPVTKIKYADYDMRRCPVPGCEGAEYAGGESLRKHLQRTHGLGLREALIVHGDNIRLAPGQEPPEGDIPCPECERKFTRPQGLAAHRAKAHGVPGTSKDSSAARAERSARKKAAAPRKTAARKAKAA